MVAHFVRLKLTLLGNTLRRSVWQTIGLAVATLYGLGVVGVLVVGAVVGGQADPALTGRVLTVGGAVVVLGWWVVPLFAYGLDSTLDPLRFVPFGIPHRRLLAGLAAAAVVSVPAVVTLLAALGASFAWVSDPVALLAALVGAIAGVALCLLGARATTTLLAPLLESRRYREVLMIVAIVPILGVGPFFSWMSSTAAGEGGLTLTLSADSASTALDQAAVVLGWTPFGAPWALAGAVHDGAWGLAAARAGVVAVTTVAVTWVWSRALARALVSPRGGAEAGRAAGLGWFGRVPASPVGAVVARCATYWTRDPRYAASLAMIPLLPLVVVALGLTSGAGGGLLLMAAPVAAFVLGFSLSNDVGYDNTAFWLHVAVGVPGRADRWGRTVPALVLGVPLVVGLTLAAVAVAGRWDALPPLLGLSLGVLGAGLGTSSVASARLVYPVPKPGESAFKSPQGAQMAAFVAQMASFGVILALMVPTLAVGLPAILVPSPLLGAITLGVGLLTAAVALVVGTRWGARVYERRMPELLSQVTAFA
ncbi:hypothetical protein [Isoptericola aurantiacus]|uniref:hypothetical protein n=1 Tax=Isoptericola aurantiacus TaxID=3377839 RepID=UPI00383B75DB